MADKELKDSELRQLRKIRNIEAFFNNKYINHWDAVFNGKIPLQTPEDLLSQFRYFVSREFTDDRYAYIEVVDVFPFDPHSSDTSHGVLYYVHNHFEEPSVRITKTGKFECEKLENLSVAVFETIHAERDFNNIGRFIDTPFQYNIPYYELGRINERLNMLKKEKTFEE